MNEESTTLEGIPYEVRVIFHPDVNEYEAVIPELGASMFTAADSTAEGACAELQRMYPVYLQEYGGAV